jgi:hypothetical protein
VNSLVRISFSKNPNRGRSAPSWSWMSYVGGIDYMKPVGGSVIWKKDVSWVIKNGQASMTLKGVARDYEVPTGTETSEAAFDMDVPNQSHNNPLRCVVVGIEKVGDDEKKKKHYVVVVCEVSSTGDAAEYERVGVGQMLGRFIKDETSDALIR